MGILKAQSNKDANQDSKPQTPVASSLVPPCEASPTIHATSTSVTGSDSESEVDLLSCEDVSNEKRGDTHGVSYHDSTSNKHGWTPVVSRRKKKTPLPAYVLQRFPPAGQSCRELALILSLLVQTSHFRYLKVHLLSLLFTIINQVFRSGQEEL